MKVKKARCTFEIDQSLYDQFKIYCIKNDKKVKEMLTEYIVEKLKQ